MVGSWKMQLISFLNSFRQFTPFIEFTAYNWLNTEKPPEKNPKENHHKASRQTFHRASRPTTSLPVASSWRSAVKRKMMCSRLGGSSIMAMASQSVLGVKDSGGIQFWKLEESLVEEIGKHFWGLHTTSRNNNVCPQRFLGEILGTLSRSSFRKVGNYIIFTR